MDNNFESNPKTIAIDIAAAQLSENLPWLEIVEQWRENYGNFLPIKPKNNTEQIKCLAAYKDRNDSNDLRAELLGKSVQAFNLKDGRIAFYKMYWSRNAINNLPSWVEILTEEEFQNQLQNKVYDENDNLVIV